MKYKVIHKNYDEINENNLLHILLQQRGVGNPEEFLHIDSNVLYDGMLLKNMDRGLNMLHWHINNNSKIHIIYDVDVDGCTAGSSIENYIKKINKNITITHSMNDNKKHGIILENLKTFDFDLLIVPDAGSNDIKQSQILYEQYDVDILILDHHEIEKENPYAIVINCQDKQYPNNTLSGAGVVYKFIREYDKKYNYNYSQDDLDLVAIGIVSDSMDLRNYETRYIAMEGLKHITNHFIKEFLIKNKIETDSIDFTFVGWKIAPFINAITRVGTEEEKIDLIEALTGENRIKKYQPRRKKKTDPKPPIEIQTLQQAMVRESTNIKGRQDRLVKKGMEALLDKINNSKLDNNKVIMVDATDVLEKSFTGLVANKLASIFKRPIIVLKKAKETKNEIIYGGSYRNYELFPLESMMDMLSQINTFDKVAGHNNAGGYEIKSNNIPITINKLNNELKNVEIEDVYLVDYEIPIGRLKEKHILQVGQWSHIWGNTLQKPIFAITNVNLKVEDIQLLGEKRNFIRIEKNIGKNKICFVKKYASEKIYNHMIMKDTKGLIKKKKSNNISMDIIGEFAINQWNGNEIPQIEIIDYNVSSGRDFRF